MKFQKKYLIGLLIIVFNTNAATAANDDILDLVIPAIISANKNTEEALNKLKLLNGRWRFSYSFEDFNFEEYYRFSGDTARASTIESGLFIMDGGGSLSPGFTSEWCDGGFIASYNIDFSNYIVLCNWGYPNYNTGDVFGFTMVNGNVFTFLQATFNPSTGELSSGFDGSGTATKISNNFRLKAKGKTNNLLARNKVSAAELIAEQRYQAFLSAKSTQKRINHKIDNSTKKLIKFLNEEMKKK